jgi:hypothetical protein
MSLSTGQYEQGSLNPLPTERAPEISMSNEHSRISLPTGNVPANGTQFEVEQHASVPNLQENLAGNRNQPRPLLPKASTAATRPYTLRRASGSVGFTCGIVSGSPWAADTRSRLRHSIRQTTFRFCRSAFHSEISSETKTPVAGSESAVDRRRKSKPLTVRTPAKDRPPSV